MVNINITFSAGTVDPSMQVEDILWYIDSETNLEIQVGKIISITKNSSTGEITLVVESPPGVVPPSQGDFIFYVKNPIVKVSSLKGYFAETQFINRSTSYGEIFAVASEVFESSK